MKILKVLPAVAVLAGGTICHELLSNSKIELPPYLAKAAAMKQFKVQ